MSLFIQLSRDRVNGWLYPSLVGIRLQTFEVAISIQCHGLASEACRAEVLRLSRQRRGRHWSTSILFLCHLCQAVLALGCLKVVLDLFARPEPVLDWHVNVKDDQAKVVWCMSTHEIDSLLSIISNFNEVKLCLEQLLIEFQKKDVIISNYAIALGLQVMTQGFVRDGFRLCVCRDR